MSIYVIGDLHLSFNVDKPMDIFGENWKEHYIKIKENWLSVVKEGDLVLLPGDISWALSLEEAHKDLSWINELPGQKIIVKGNHDYWWASVSKMNELYSSIKFIYNNHYEYNNIGICGSRGWLCPNDNEFTEHDLKIYNREVDRIERSINMAKKDGVEEIIVIMHYPPTNDKLEDSKFTELFERYDIKKVYYGHLHTEEGFESGIKEIRNGVEYRLTSCDFLDFKLLKID